MRGHIWSMGYYINSAGQHATVDVIRKYVENQERRNEYEQVYSIPLMLLQDTGGLPLKASLSINRIRLSL